LICSPLFSIRQAEAAAHPAAALTESYKPLNSLAVFSRLNRTSARKNYSTCADGVRMNTSQEIRQAMADYMSGKMGRLS
jgi:hypothetical protein